MATKKLTLEPKISKKYSLCRGKEFRDDPLVCMMLNGVIASATIIVSGSIVVIGNTIHWLEYKSGCTPKHNKQINKDKKQLVFAPSSPF